MVPLAQVNTHPQGGDSNAAPFMGSAVGNEGTDAPLLLHRGHLCPIHPDPETDARFVERKEARLNAPEGATYVRGYYRGRVR